MILHVMCGEYLVVVGILMTYLFIAAILRNIYLKGIRPRHPSASGILTIYIFLGPISLSRSSKTFESIPNILEKRRTEKPTRSTIKRPEK